MRIWTATAHSDGVDDPAAERAEPLDAAVGALGAVTEGGPEEPPQRVAAEADREECEQEVAEATAARPSAAHPAGS